MEKLVEVPGVVVAVKILEGCPDCLTERSGTTATKLAAAEIRLEDAQAKFCVLLTKECILVGHSLENDLLASRFSHGRIIDTALLFR